MPEVGAYTFSGFRGSVAESAPLKNQPAAKMRRRQRLGGLVFQGSGRRGPDSRVCLSTQARLAIAIRCRLLPFARCALGTGLYDDGGTAKAELPADAVGKVALVGEMQRPAAIHEHGEGRRADRVLGDVKNLTLFELQTLHKAVQFASGDAFGCRFEDFANEAEER